MKKGNKLIIVIFIITIFLFCSVNVQQITVHAASGTKVEVVYSSYNDTDTNNQLTHQTDLTMTDMDNTSTTATIIVDPSITYQQWDGFGGSLEDDTIWELGRLSSSDKEDVLNDLFNPETGNNYTLMRLSIGACDFSPDYDSSISPDKGYWTYDDNDGNADPNLTNFSIQRDIDDGVIDTLLEVLEINPEVRFFASMWSPPAWMKTSGTLVDGGHVQSQYYSALANYYVKYIQAYEGEGIPIYAVTLQNEPAISVGYPSTIWSVDEYVAFAQVLGAAFETNDIKTKIWALDDNEIFAYDYADVMQNSSSEQYIDGFGFHNYTGLTLTQPTALSYQYPDTTMHVTEITNGSYKLIEYFRNWVSSYAYWLTFIEFVDPGPGPGFWEEEYRDPETNPDFWVDSQVSWAGTPGSSTYNLNSWYYTFGQFSRYIQTGAVRIESTAAAGDDISNVAFKNPDGTIVVIVINREYSQYNSVDMGTSSKQIKIATPDGQIIDTIPGDTVATYKWSTTTGDTLSKTSWSAAASDTYGQYNASQAVDGNTSTIWTSGTNETSGQYYILDMSSSKTFDQITLNNEGFSGDYPSGYQVFVSSDGTTWGSAIASGTGTGHMTNITFSSQTARYIKIALTSSASHWWTISNISLYDSASGLLSNTDWSATASSTNGSDTPSKAIDGSNASRWSSGAAQQSGQWFIVDLGETTTFNKIEMDSGANEGDYPKGYEVYVSSNGSSWGSAIASGAGIGKSVQSSFPTQNARYIKVVLTESDSNNWWSISEFRVYNQSPDLMNRADWTVTAYTSGGGTSASSMIDGNISTRWANGEAQEDGQWVKIDMDDIYPICGVALNAGGFTGDYPRGYTVEISTDGINWHTVAEGAIPSQDNLISFPFTYARFVKITQTGTASSNWWSIAEINVLIEDYSSDLTSISHSGWSATASHTESGGSAANAIDGQLQEPRDEPYNWGSIDDTASRWSSGKAQEGNEWFQVDMGSSQTFSAVEVNCGPYTNDYASHYIVYVSSDGTNWTPIATGDGYGPVMRIEFPEVTARYININQTGTASNKWWTIAEFNVLY